MGKIIKLPSRYEVIVGNIGIVYRGTEGRQAYADYWHYRRQSIHETGRAGGEPVTLCKDGEIVKEHQPKENANV